MNEMQNARPLKCLEGSMIVAFIPALDRKELSLVRLHKVEPAGIWIESQEFTERMMKQFAAAVSQTTLLMFVPFHGVSYIVSSIKAVSLSEEALGLRGGIE
jgi:hypothetical protein